MTHLIDNNEMDPHTECGLALIGEFGQTEIVTGSSYSPLNRV